MTYKFYNSVFLSHGLDLSPDTEAATADQILPLVKCELRLAFAPADGHTIHSEKEIVQIPLKMKYRSARSAWCMTASILWGLRQGN